MAERIGCLFLLLSCAIAQQTPFSSVPPPAEDGLRFTRDLPSIEVKDAQGKLWHPADFRGKFTLVYIWHTFEARTVDAHRGRGQDAILTEVGMPDLVEVQRFYERTAGKGRLQVLTFCSDYDYTHAPEYMKTAGFTFPVVADWTVIEKLFGPEARTVRYWVIGPNGRLSAPFRAWRLGRVMYELESAAGR